MEPDVHIPRVLNWYIVTGRDEYIMGMQNLHEVLR